MSRGNIAFIPARSGSKRVVDKNIKTLNRHPLIAYTIQTAISSRVFDKVICATDSELYASIAEYYGAEVPFLRPNEISGDKSPDIEWVRWMLDELSRRNMQFEAFSILRPTCPLRTPKSITEAWEIFSSDKNADSIRAIQLCKEHPAKMWKIKGDRMTPLIEGNLSGTPWHSSQYAALPEIYSQNASLEIAWTKTVYKFDSISGNEIIPYKSKNLEGFDLNTEEDWILLQHFVKKDPTLLPIIEKKPYIADSN